MKIEEVIERLEKATEGSRDLDACVHQLVPVREYDDLDEVPRHMFISHYTTSIDSALTLVPEGFFWFIGHLDHSDRRFVTTITENGFIDSPSWGGFHMTVAVSICIAALRARAATGKGEE